ncbi:hypothetical protein A2686_01155 [Candidatus Woesebacteria bacterium RIFCSPHIGHO2_01_FULL_38_10]|uniref:HTH merR-type domain-containing protein n=1 Tax=Candidatus Woesebacteria bacterium RIFCSPLOWO2_01_FULL_39_10b TaxID=1802517 RepID=A0A1F8B5C2_9BACT|nr:MAG: hypothetical protein A2686_01155 [Candidatus Woesebacteria bacterium RIFCSPHIGHO2_01_FULL_38_10]OGM59232.1 MAG: hypothetical protein A2892_05145 [Candidatus Woesebacteria bacterium RIFCSPLOWO2_01_FULL_39_10b]
MQNVQDLQEKKTPLLSIGEASEYLGISIDTLRRWEKKGKLKVLRSPGGHRYFKKENLDNVFGTKYERSDQSTTNDSKSKFYEVIQEKKIINIFPEIPIEVFKPLDEKKVAIPENKPIALISQEKSFKEVEYSITPIEESPTLIPPVISLPTNTQKALSEDAQVKSDLEQNLTSINIKIEAKKIYVTLVILIVSLLLIFILLYILTKPQILSPIP